MSPGGLLRIEKGETDQQGDPNLFFQELTPLMAARHGGRDLQMFLDTGNNTTFLYPSARQILSQGETANLRKKREQMGGAGGTTKRSSEIIPALRFEIFGKEVELKDLSLISKQPSGESGYRDGVFGADVLENGFTLDFRSMTFRPLAQ